MRRMIPAIIMITCFAVLSACQDESHDEPADRVHLAELEAEIDELIGEALGNDITDCRSIAFGDKPCGGPWKYKVFSISGLDTLELGELVASYNKFNTILNKRYGWMSDCMGVTPPNLDCVDGHCIAGE